MATTYYDADADLNLIRSRKVAIVGYGSQGHAHALNLHDSGVPVQVGLRPESATREQVTRDGLQVRSVPEVSQWADVVVMLAPDTIQPRIYNEQMSPHLGPGDTLMFSHGFNIRYGTIEPAARIDVSMIAPKSPGHRVRETYLSGEGTPALLAVEQDPSGQARAVALSYAKALGCARAGVIETTFTEETETDLFGEQAVLCGGVSELVKAAFETLVEAGYQPEIAYFECLHELKLIVDLMYRGGLNYMRYSVSDTAEYGDYESGPRVIDEHVRGTMRQLLAEVQDGSFAERWIRENEEGQPRFRPQRQKDRSLLIESVGRELRSRMSFLDPVEILPEKEPVSD
jgi:ketol-acid reductoisomerase